MKLYLFETCPYCVRARMVLGLKDIPCELAYLSGDDAETPTRLIGAKQVPILETDDGKYLGESLDIIRYLDRSNGEPLLNGGSISPDLENWYADMRREIDQLCYPRYAEIAPPELQTAAAMEFFRSSRKDKMGISLSEAMDNTTVLCRKIEDSLGALEPHVERYFDRGNKITVDEFFLFPILRSLTLVKALDMPAKLQRYVQSLSRRCEVPLYSDIAI